MAAGSRGYAGTCARGEGEDFHRERSGLGEGWWARRDRDIGAGGREACLCGSRELGAGLEGKGGCWTGDARHPSRVLWGPGQGGIGEAVRSGCGCALEVSRTSTCANPSVLDMLLPVARDGRKADGELVTGLRGPGRRGFGGATWSVAVEMVGMRADRYPHPGTPTIWHETRKAAAGGRWVLERASRAGLMGLGPVGVRRACKVLYGRDNRTTARLVRWRVPGKFCIAEFLWESLF